jgi:hypothetical protein
MGTIPRHAVPARLRKLRLDRDPVARLEFEFIGTAMR